MSPLQRKLLLCLLLLFITSTLISAAQSQNNYIFSRTRLLLELEDDDIDSSSDHEPIIKKSSTNKNQSKLIKQSSNSSKNQTKLTKTSNLATKNQTKLTKTSNIAPKNQTKLTKTSSLNELKNQTKLSKSSNMAPKNQTKLIKSPPSDSSKNKATKSASTQAMTKSQMKKASDEVPPKITKKAQKVVEEEEEEDLVSELTDLPSRFQETFLPDMERISKTSKMYLKKYNSQFTKGFKPYVGHKYASTLAWVISLAFIIIPLILVSLLFSKITAYFSLQKFLTFIQIYLSIYFSILALWWVATGVEPLKFLYAAAQSTYVCVQVLQTLAYVLYLLLLLMYLLLLFSTESGAPTRLLGLAQTAVGLAVGLHYYITVFHRALLHQPPKASWKVHALYATSFVLISLLGSLHTRKKAYFQDDGQEGKKS